MMQVDRRDTEQQMRTVLNEKQGRQYLALEAKERGSVSLVAQEASVSPLPSDAESEKWKQEQARQQETDSEKREAGAKQQARKRSPCLRIWRDSLPPKGDPMSLLNWTSTSVAQLKEAVQARGHPIAERARRDVVLSLGYSLRATQKTLDGNSPEDRAAQCTQINQRCEQCEQQGTPILAVDCKKKELLGTFKHTGAAWQAKGEQTSVNVCDFLSLADGQAIPYGVSDLVHNRGVVNVGIEHDTAECAVESSGRWWHHAGHALSPRQERTAQHCRWGRVQGGQKSVMEAAIARLRH